MVFISGDRANIDTGSDQRKNGHQFTHRNCYRPIRLLDEARGCMSLAVRIVDRLNKSAVRNAETSHERAKELGRGSSHKW